jgi:NADH dehydrogenase/NADH:ubiquinone oxidoreductase subunit G
MTIQITIDGRSLSVEAGKTVLQAARENGIDIPTLCDYPGLKSHGSCRMCIVEIEGRSNTPTACTTLAESGMVVQTHSPMVNALRVELFKLLLSEHPSSCLLCEEKGHCDECMVTLRKTGVTTGCRSCPQDGQCELQTLADRLQIVEGGYPVRYRMLPVEKKDPFIDRDYNLCILCERCVRVCEENHFSSTVTLTSRGTNTVVGTPFGQRLLQAGCSFCGSCVEVCTTGALSEKVRKWSGVPEREVSTTCPLCSAGCQIRLLVKNGMVIGSLPDHANGTDTLCVKGRFGITEMVNHPTRLQNLKLLDHEGNVQVGWEKAIEIAAGKISACGPEKYGLVVSADCSNETMYIAQKFVREAVHSKSIYLSSAAAYGRGWQTIQRLYGSSKPLSALSEADAILCLGFDGKYVQSVVETKLHHAKQMGAKVITLDTRDQSLRKYADEWLQPAPGEEADLLEMFAEILRERGAAPQLWPIPPQAQRSVRILLESKQPVVLVGFSFLTHPDNVNLLKLIEKLVGQTHAQLVVLPDKANLGGALQMGITNPLTAKDLQDLEVLHLIGEELPAELPVGPFVLYQNIFPPASVPASGLVMPAAAFTEESGTFIDHAGETRSLQKAVDAPGSALPSWQILCRIAGRLGAPGFAFENEEQIRAEMESTGYAGAETEASILNLFQPNSVVFPSNRADDHAYMGFPLRTRVAGFQVLYPEPLPKNK